MSTLVPSLPVNRRVSEFLIQYVLPLGWAVLLTGLFWVGNRSAVHTLFYVLLALPTLVALVLRPRLLKPLLGNSLFIAFLLFSVYIFISQFWAAGIDGFDDGYKRPFYLGLLLFSAGLMNHIDAPRFILCTRAAAVLAAVFAAGSVVWFLVTPRPIDGRLTGYGALENPLLTAHVLGAFAAYWLASWILAPRMLDALSLLCLAALGVAILATGSRTPMVGLGAAVLWLLVVGNRRRALLLVGLVAALVVVLLLVDPAQITQRGVSYRPSIWADSLHQISLKPLLGYGYGTSMTVSIPELPGVTFSDPHNIELGVLYSAGIVGLVLWLGLYATAARWCWQLRRDPLMIIASTWLIYGFAAGFTEGNAFFSRPKEHWFLIWIPMAMVYGRALALRLQAR